MYVRVLGIDTSQSVERFSSQLVGINMLTTTATTMATEESIRIVCLKSSLQILQRPGTARYHLSNILQVHLTELDFHVMTYSRIPVQAFMNGEKQHYLFIGMSLLITLLSLMNSAKFKIAGCKTSQYRIVHAAAFNYYYFTRSLLVLFEKIQILVFVLNSLQ